MTGAHLRERYLDLDFLWVQRGCCRVEVEVEERGRLLLREEVALSGDVENTAEIWRRKIWEKAWEKRPESQKPR